MNFPIEKHNLLTCYEIDSHDLDIFIQEQYKMSEFSCIADQEWGNYESHKFCVEKKELNKFDLEKVNKFKDGEYDIYLLDSILTDLAHRGVLPECTILVNVFW